MNGRGCSLSAPGRVGAKRDISLARPGRRGAARGCREDSGSLATLWGGLRSAIPECVTRRDNAGISVAIGKGLNGPKTRG